MTAVGVFNGNWRGEEMREYLNGVRSDGKKLVELGSCGHELKSRPLWMVGKSQLCFSCWENEVAEQKRLMENITEEAQAEYFDEIADSAHAEPRQIGEDVVFGSADWFDAIPEVSL